MIKSLSAAHHQLLNSNLHSLASAEPETDAFLLRYALQPITHDSAELINAMTNQRHSDESLLKRLSFVHCARSLTEFLDDTHIWYL